MDRRVFLKKVAKLVGTSAAGVSLTKLQIATVATGLSGTIGCARNPVESDPLNRDNNALMAPFCQNLHTCDGFVHNCSGIDFDCVDVEFVCDAQERFTCNAAEFVCSKDFACSSTEIFQCREFSIVHQGSLTIN